MRWFPVLLFSSLTCSCKQNLKESNPHQGALRQKIFAAPLPIDTSYTDTRKRIAIKRNELALYYAKANATDKFQIKEAIIDCWVQGVGTGLYRHWAGTLWDYNGTTRVPGQGTIACGYFVTTLLLDMGMALNRTRLSTCAASEMMHRLVPHQKMKTLNGLPYPLFCDSLWHLGKGVYVIGLDFHVGFIVNDGKNCWFIHSNYINRQGVTKELVQLSAALKASGTRWLVDLTGDEDFIHQWLIAQPV